MGKRYTIEDFIQKARIKHGDKYDYTKSVYTKSVDHIIIICPEHGEFSQIAANHMRGKGCIHCAGVAKSSSKEFKEKARKVHGKKYTYEKVIYTGNKDKVEVTCPRHGGFTQTPNSHLKGRGCPVCYREGQVQDTRTFIEKALEIHGTTYTYEKVQYKGSNTKVTITCPVHGDFEQRATHHISGHGCSKCVGTYNPTSEEVRERIERRFPDRFVLDSLKYINQKTKIEVICKIHGSFEALPDAMLTGVGDCPACRESRETYLYLMEVGTYPPVYKVGISYSPEQRAVRLSNNKLAYPFRVLQISKPFSTYSLAKAAEGKLHKKYEAYNDRDVLGSEVEGYTEIFKLPSDEVSRLIELLRSD